MERMAPLELGSIVWAEVPDANGFRKLRPVVIVTPTDQIKPDSPLQVVAVTTRILDPLPSDYVLLPWHAQGHPRTRLNKKCAAVCSWRCRIRPSEVKTMTGAVPGQALARILELIAESPTKPLAPRSDPPA